ncbi:MAG TPA: transglycosylase SLT domain-containing protein [Candidatus Baltobacteraceae bacterium]|jgi:soluble lytic murein transglycosylase|nr:transglycosylase SLT domain-containing protein [Candidatus Baltobacteraceae bacterium]
MAIPTPSANIPTPPPENRGNFPRRTGLAHRPVTRALGPVAQAFRPEAFHALATKLSVSPRSWAVLFSVLFLVLSLLFAGDLSAQTKKKKKKPTHPKSPACATGCKPDTTAPALDSSTPEDAAAQKELALLARDLHRGTPGAYEKLAAFANKNNSSVWGQRAALALGYEDYSKNHAQQALIWLQKAKPDTLLLEYTLFWTAQSERALGKNADAAKDLAQILKDFPGAVFKEQVLEAYTSAANAIGRPQDALDMLATYAGTGSKPNLLLARARAEEAAHKSVPAAKDYQTLFYKYPLADESKDAAVALPRLNKQLHTEFPYATGEMQDQRAQIFYDAHKWHEARTEYEKLATILKDPANPIRQRALVRSAECRQHPKPSPSLFVKLAVTDPEADAERLYDLSQAWRSDKRETEMLAAIEKNAAQYPQSRWTEDALMAAGNYYWVELDRAKAGNYYQRVLDSFPGGRHAQNAEWRIAWIAYIQRQPFADEKMINFLRKYPSTGTAVNALYWLGRNAERNGNPTRARAFYEKATDRFPSTYFAHAADQRLAKLAPGDSDPADALAEVPAPPPLRPFDEPIAPLVAERWNRAQALRTIAFDASAELELKAAFAATASPRYMVEAAQAAFDQGHFATGMAYGRIAVPNFDSRKLSDVPSNVWKVLFPFPYEAVIRREAERNNFDPMFAAGLIRQESTFQADAVSHADAIGLMQILPKTGRLLAKERKIRYTKNSLFDPNINIELGMLYISNLTRATGGPEYAAAAYNAGEDRISLWKSERTYDEVPELVESIPFTETREYVQIVLRNTDMYRALYGETPKSTVSAATPHPTRYLSAQSR